MTEPATTNRAERAARSIAVDYPEALDLIDPNRRHRDMLLSLLAISWATGALAGLDEAREQTAAAVHALSIGLVP